MDQVDLSNENLKSLRKSRNLLLIEVGNACNLLPSTIFKIENGRNYKDEDLKKVKSFYSTIQ
ncbi:helix-turn-helix transcriptional regulator [Cytobacillus praedii]|uniref:helix-turn-helix transcriptional regulator n=1 Tax=Cytobacillus praedii TaxID=1742358 RepID=UPI002E1FD195|nr:helix-turn-helix transcriptional regulator [Cytobacillus praedii]